MWIIDLFNDKSSFLVSTILRLILACLFGGIIGYEREHVHRPAGFRTHLLVCVGSALVMITSEYIYYAFASKVNVDPARLGAQVISGIGFLGAGTIIKEGISVKGLTTAASLWTVSCVGLAVGIGFYTGALISTVIVFLALVLMKKTKKQKSSQKGVKIYIHTQIKKGETHQISMLIEEMGAIIRKIDNISSDKNGEMILCYLIDMSDKILLAELIENVLCHETVRSAYEASYC